LSAEQRWGKQLWTLLVVNSGIEMQKEMHIAMILWQRPM